MSASATRAVTGDARAGEGRMRVLICVLRFGGCGATVCADGVLVCKVF